MRNSPLNLSLITALAALGSSAPAIDLAQSGRLPRSGWGKGRDRLIVRDGVVGRESQFANLNDRDKKHRYFICAGKLRNRKKLLRGCGGNC